MRREVRSIILALLLLAGGAAPVAAQLNRYYYYGKAHRDYLRGEYSRGIQDINRFLAYQPQDEIGLYLRALCKFELKDFRGALDDLDSGLENKPFAVDLLVLRGAARGEMGQAREALLDLELAHDLRPNARNILYLRGIAYFQLENYEAAIGDFDRMLAWEPSHLGARINRGTAALLRQDTLSAVRDYQSAMHANPYSAAPHVNLARLYLEARSLDSALSEINLALELAPKAPQAMLIKALIQHGQGKAEKAIETLTTTLRIAPRNSLALYNRALMYSQLEKWHEALRDYQAAASISPTNVLIRYNTGIALLQLGRKARAEEALGLAIELYPDFARAYRLRARIRAASGNPMGAQQDFARADSLTARYRKGELGEMSDTSARFSRLMAFEQNFSTNSRALLQGEEAGEEMLPLATVCVGQTQPHEEWGPVARVDSLCKAPYFALVVPSTDTARTVNLSLLPPLQNANAINLIRAISEVQKNRYDEALGILPDVPNWGEWMALAQCLRATTLIQKIRYAPAYARGDAGASRQDAREKQDKLYAEPIGILDTLQARSPSPYLLYTRATAHYLSRNLPKAERDLTEALEQNPRFAEAYYNRALVRMLMHRDEEACRDLSRAGELGVDRAYRIIATQCRR